MADCSACVNKGIYCSDCIHSEKNCHLEDCFEEVEEEDLL